MNKAKYRIVKHQYDKNDALYHIESRFLFFWTDDFFEVFRNYESAEEYVKRLLEPEQKPKKTIIKYF